MNKYKAKKVIVDDQVFDSKKEARRYTQLVRLLDTGVIRNLCRQMEFVLIPVQRDADIITKTGKKKPGRVLERKVSYVADFVYEKDGHTVVEDVKGYRGGGAYAVFTIKRKLMLEKYGIQVKEV